MTPSEWLNFRFDAETEARLADLAEKANEGLLTDNEREEYATYVEFIDLVGIIQARARRAQDRDEWPKQ